MFTTVFGCDPVDPDNNSMLFFANFDPNDPDDPCTFFSQTTIPTILILNLDNFDPDDPKNPNGFML